eukprot:COSAG02_NODE_738_length_17838_cov_10.051412_12_plen_57_part_00
MRIGNSVEGKKTLLGPYDKYCTCISSMVIKHSDPTPLDSLAILRILAATENPILAQ